MNIVKVNQIIPERSFSNMLDEIFNKNIGQIVGTDVDHNRPAVNISETEANYKIDVAAPGLSKEDFTIALDKNILTISASKKNEDSETDKNNWRRKEFNYSSFSRSFTLNDEIEIIHIVATYTHGILEVSLPKKEEAKPLPPRTISIN